LTIAVVGAKAVELDEGGEVVAAVDAAGVRRIVLVIEPGEGLACAAARRALHMYLDALWMEERDELEARLRKFFGLDGGRSP